MPQPIQLTKEFPLYSKTRTFLATIAGELQPTFHAMRRAIWNQNGSIGQQADWSDPDAWITARLTGAEAALADRIWHISQRTINPRYLDGYWALSNRHALITVDDDGVIQLSGMGSQFIIGNVATLMEMDRQEAIFIILRIMWETGPDKWADYLPEFAAYCDRCTALHAESGQKDALTERLANLVERGLVSKDGTAYAITAAGRGYLAGYILV